MKIRFVLCHRTENVSGEVRQVVLANALRKHGVDAVVFAMSSKPTATEIEYDDSQALVFFPADDISQSAHDTLSRSLLEQLVSESPDLILVKGIDYAITKAIFEKFPKQQLGAVIGGVANHPLLHQCSVIFFETDRQSANFTCDALKLTLPKFVQWNNVLEHGVNGVDFDIVNVGNFDEDRKAQELLLPFIFNKRVVLIGGGRKLDSFHSICANRTNVELPGFVSSDRLYEYLSRSRLMVHCSTWDGYPRAVAEGLCAGVPVIGLAGVLDGIAPEPLIRTVSLERLHSMVFDVLNNPGDLNTAGREAAAYMRTNASETRLCELFLQGVEAVVGQV